MHQALRKPPPLLIHRKGPRLKECDTSFLWLIYSGPCNPHTCASPHLSSSLTPLVTQMVKNCAEQCPLPTFPKLILI